MHISTSNVKYYLKDKIKLYLSEAPRRQSIGQSSGYQPPQAAARRNTAAPAADSDSGIGSVVSAVAPTAVALAAPSIVSGTSVAAATTAATTAATSTGAAISSTAAAAAPALVAGAAIGGAVVAGAAIGTAAGYGINTAVDKAFGTNQAELQMDADTYKPTNIWQGVKDLFTTQKDIEDETQSEVDQAKAKYESEGHGAARRAADAEAAAQVAKFDADQKIKKEQEQNIKFKAQADSGNTRIKGGSITFDSSQQQRSSLKDETGVRNVIRVNDQGQEVFFKVKNAPVPRVEGSDENSTINKARQDLATRQKGHIKLGDVNVDLAQQQGNGPDADTLTERASQSRAPAAPAATAEAPAAPAATAEAPAAPATTQKTGSTGNKYASSGLKRPGDINGDGLVDDADLPSRSTAPAQQQGNGPDADTLTKGASQSRAPAAPAKTQKTGSKYASSGLKKPGDINGDGLVDDADLPSRSTAPTQQQGKSKKRR